MIDEPCPGTMELDGAGSGGGSTWCLGGLDLGNGGQVIGVDERRRGSGENTIGESRGLVAAGNGGCWEARA